MRHLLLSLAVSALSVGACVDLPDEPAPSPALEGADPWAMPEGAVATHAVQAKDDNPPIGGPPPGAGSFTLSSTIEQEFTWYNEVLSTSTGLDGVVYAAGYRYIVSPVADYVAALTKYGPTGAIVWTQTWNSHVCFGCQGGEQWNDVVVTADGSAIFAVGMTPTASNGIDWIVAKYTAAGALSWSQIVGTAGTDYASGVVYDDATGALFVGGAWNTTGARLVRLDGVTGDLVWSDAATFTAINDLGLDPTTGGAAGATLYAVGNTLITALSLSGASLWSGPLPAIGYGVDVDQVTGQICVGGTGFNLTSPVSGQDGWLRRYSTAGAPQWTRIYDVSSPIGGVDEVFLSAAARHGGHGCVAAGQTQSGSAGTNILTVSIAGNGLGAPNVDIADFQSRDNPGYHVEVGRGASNPNAGRALVTGRSWSINGGPSPQPYSYDAVMRWLSF